jgi:DNA modification methylase
MAKAIDIPLELNAIYNMDCVVGMKQFAKQNVTADLIVADPPYVISRPSNFATMKDRKNARTGTDFGDWDTEFDNKPWLKAAYEILKPGGALLLFNDFKKITELIQSAEKIGYTFKDVLVWEKSNPMPRNRDRRYVPSLEMILWFVKNPKKKWTFNRQSKTYQSPVLKFASESGGAFKRYHPTQKPVKLLETLIKIHSEKGETVLDPFMGSGATAIAALETGRKYLGFELDEGYYQTLTKRIAGHNA